MKYAFDGCWMIFPIPGPYISSFLWRIFRGSLGGGDEKKLFEGMYVFSVY